MMKWLIRWRLAAFERDFGYDVSYVREILDADARAFFAFARIQSLSSYRRDVPREPYWAAKIVGAVAEDCGPCTQLVVTMGLRAGADPKALAQTLANDEATMTDDVRLAVRFARLTLAHDPEADGLREEILRRWGPRALVSLAFAVAAGRIYPTVKYALGHGRSCQRVMVGDEKVDVVHATRLAAA